MSNKESLNNGVSLANAVSLLLIAIKEGELVVFHNEDTTFDYIGLLEECNKRPLLTYVVIEDSKKVMLNCYSDIEINSVLSLIKERMLSIVSIKVH